MSQVRVLPSALQLPANAAVLLSEILSEIGSNHPFDHLSFPNRLAGAIRSDRISLGPDARNVAWVDVRLCSDWPHARFYESNKPPEAAFLRTLRDLSTASNRLARELGDLTSSAKAAARSPMSFSSTRSTI